MILLTDNATADVIAVTLQENRTITDDVMYYLFVFKHVLTKQVVNVIYANTDDTSTNVDRMNKFSIDTSVVFAGAPAGEWHYWAYEQTSDTNTDPANAVSLVEQGKMELVKSVGFTFTKYTTTTTYKAYAG